jgi:hypothetical protein
LTQIYIKWESHPIKECFMLAGENIHAIEKLCKLFDLNKPFFLDTDKHRAYFEKYLPIKNVIIHTNFYNGLRRIYGDKSERPKDDSLDLKIFSVLIDNGLDIDVQFEKGQSVLFQVYENKVLVKYLCDKVRELNLCDENNRTFLEFYIDHCLTPPQIAFGNGMFNAYETDRDYSEDFEVIQYVISKGGLVNHSYSNGWIYFMFQALNTKNKYALKQGVQFFSEVNGGTSLIDVFSKYANQDQMSQIDLLLKSN